MLLEIDGSFGEGGGQILRTSLGLSLVTGKPFRIDKIRAGRQKPGLLRQHLTAVLAAAEVSQASVAGATLGSTCVTFTPGAVRPGEYRFVIGTAGSGTLVLQTVLPALMLAKAESKVTIEGGTHNHAAPPYHFLAQTFAPLVQRMGPKIALEFARYGFYPAGGGKFSATITPVPQLSPFDLDARGEITSRRVVAVVANLPRHIAHREAETAIEMLGWGADRYTVESTRESAGPGNVVMVEVGSEQVTEIFTSFGQIGVSAERVASRAAKDAREYLVSCAAAGEHLADQLLLPFALAGGGSFTATKLNLHARTNMEVIAMFLPVHFATSDGEGFVRLNVEPAYDRTTPVSAVS
jgi:RNA 3'-terminal phosphate cyclase (ATP)